MKDPLDWMETRLQALIEGSLASLLPGGKARASLGRRLIEAMKANLITTANQDQAAPNIYTLQVNPAQAPLWQADPVLLERLAGMLTEVAGEAGIHFLGPLAIRLRPNPQVSPQEVRVEASIGRDPLSITSALPAEQYSPEKKAEPQGQAFLIVDGKDLFPLRQSVVNIGRRPDNHLVISDPRVSRAHAQLRLVRGQYFLFDLNSTGGTYVNGQRISRYGLNPGDVISLAGVPLIFGLESGPGDAPVDEEGDLPPGSTQAISPQDPGPTRKRGRP